MNRILLSALCLPFLLHAIPYSVEEDQQRNVQAISNMVLELQEFTMQVTVDGETNEHHIPERSQTITTNASISFSDTISNIQGDQPRRIEREFSELRVSEMQEISAEGQDDVSAERTGTSLFEGQTVSLVLDGEEQWSASIEDNEDFDQGLLDKLTAHFGFVDFLPEGLQAEVGDTWDIPLEAFAQLRIPAGSLSFEFDQESPFSGYGNQFIENLDGEFTAELVEWDDEEERAVIQLACQLQTSTSDGFELELEGAEGEVTRNSRIGFELEGELVWDLAQGCLRSMAMDGDISTTVTITETIRPDDGPFDERFKTQIMLLEGTLAHSLSVD